MTIAFSLLAIVVISVACLIRAEISGNRKQTYFFKPVSTFIIILMVLLALLMREGSGLYRGLILVGLLFCLGGGDIALMFDSSKAFRTGLALFLAGHLVYIAAFVYFNGYFFKGYLITVPIWIICFAFYLFLYPGLGNQKLPVFIYIIIISYMLNSAVLTVYSSYFTRSQSLLLVFGAIAFYISDGMLAVNQFRYRFKYNRISLAFYYTAQYLIALSAW